MVDLIEEFKARDYSYVGQNCNHFTDEACMRLLGKRIPLFINRLARIGNWIRFLLPQILKSLHPLEKSA